MNTDTLTSLYVLDENGNPIQETDTLKWAQWFEARKLGSSRIVAKTFIQTSSTEKLVEVSTVFLGMDHSFSLGGPPILYETMIFGGEHDQNQWRYATRSEAVEGHSKACALVMGRSNDSGL